MIDVPYSCIILYNCIASLTSPPLAFGGMPDHAPRRKTETQLYEPSGNPVEAPRGAAQNSEAYTRG